MVDKEMRELIRKYKQTKPIGMRGKTERGMRQVYELADAKKREELKQSVKDALDGRP